MLEFLRERHLASLTTQRRDGTPHVVPVGFSYDPEKSEVRVITFAGSQKLVNAQRGGRGAVSQVGSPSKDRSVPPTTRPKWLLP
jgi:nitroimidazol reductase NimA-like FMN-containing flavoprotein (pyridoxamine 5'-phosphate oxidase superfamily)